MMTPISYLLIPRHSLDIQTEKPTTSFKKQFLLMDRTLVMWPFAGMLLRSWVKPYSAADRGQRPSSQERVLTEISGVISFPKQNKGRLSPKGSLFLSVKQYTNPRSSTELQLKKLL